MSTLRIRGSLADPGLRCRWALLGEGREALLGEGPLVELPRRARHVQLVIPASEVLTTRARLPRGAARRGGAVLAFAVEDETLGDPESVEVSWLGSDGEGDVLAVFDKHGLKRWLDALGAAGLEPAEVVCETLLLPRHPDEWSVAWDGAEGFVRTGPLEGAATDCGDARCAPLGLALMLEAAAARQALPAGVCIHPASPELAPDLDAWQAQLGIALRLGPSWDWASAPHGGGVNLLPARSRWRIAPAGLARLKPAAWIVAAALAIHALALVADWAVLADQRRTVLRQMDARFRALFPDTVAVVNPALQMRRKLADARHTAGQPDSGDFLPMIDAVAASMNELPPDSLRTAAYETGRLTLDLATVDDTQLRRVVLRLRQAGFTVETARAAARSGPPTVLVTVRAS